MHAYALAGLVLPLLALAQTSTKCNPMQQTCPADKGLDQSSYSVDFTKGPNSDFAMTYGDANYDGNGLSFTIKQPKQAPTMQSDFYFFFGTISAVAKAAKGTGIVSCVILESDDLDEIDWEWLGGSPNQVQTDYFGKGNTTAYNRGGFANVDDAQDTWHNYTIEWTSSHTTWYIDGTAVRTLNFADAVGGTNYPQTPMRVKLGIWSASDTGAPGTIAWAGGETNYSDGPFTMYIKSLSINNYNPAGSYTYSDKSGSWQSIKMSSEQPKAQSSAAASAAASVSAAPTIYPTIYPEMATSTTSGSSHHTSVASSASKESKAASSSAAAADGTKTAAEESAQSTKDVSSASASASETPSSKSLASSSMFKIDTQVLSAVLLLAISQLF